MFLVKCIQKRLFAILCNQKRRVFTRRPKCVADEKPSINAMCAASPHTVVLEYDSSLNGASELKRVTCSACLSNVSASNNVALVAFLASPCKPVPTSLDRPEPILSHRIQVGRSFVHESHRMYIYRGLMYCAHCGARGQATRIQLLAGLCKTPEKLSNGAKTIAAIKAGKKPPGVAQWPCDVKSLAVMKPFFAKGQK